MTQQQIEHAKAKAIAAFRKREVGRGKLTPFEAALMTAEEKVFAKGWDAAVVAMER